MVTDLDGAPTLPGLWAAARWPAPASTAPTGWRRTRCSTGWCSAPGCVEAIARGQGRPGADRRHARRSSASPTGQPGGRSPACCRRRRPSPRPEHAAATRASQQVDDRDAGVLRGRGEALGRRGALTASTAPAWRSACALPRSTNLATVVEPGRRAALGAARNRRGAHTRPDYPDAAPTVLGRLVISPPAAPRRFVVPAPRSRVVSQFDPPRHRGPRRRRPRPRRGPRRARRPHRRAAARRTPPADGHIRARADGVLAGTALRRPRPSPARPVGPRRVGAPPTATRSTPGTVAIGSRARCVACSPASAPRSTSSCHCPGIATLTRRFVDAAASGGPHPGHPQDHPRPARAREGRGARRRRRQPPRTCPMGPDQGQPPRRPAASRRGRRRPRPLAGPDRRGRVRRPRRRCARRARRPGPTRAARQHDPRARSRDAVARSSAAPAPVEVSGGITLDTVGRLRRGGRRLHLRRRPHPFGARCSTSASTCERASGGASCCSPSTPATPRPWSGCSTPATATGGSSRRAARPLAHRHRRRAHLRRARADGPAVPRLPRLLVRRRRSPASRSPRSCPASPAELREMTERYFGFPALVLEPGRTHRHADPLRQPEGGRRRPHRQRRRPPTTSTAARRSSSTSAPPPRSRR